MYIYEEERDISDFPLYTSKSLEFYLDGFYHKKIGIIDIETTGLSPESSHFILGGMVIFSEHRVHIRQIMADDIAEEAKILGIYLKEISTLDLIVSYNGKHFDINFLIERAKRLLQGKFFYIPFHLDIYLFLNGHSSLRKILPNLKQKTVENYMGLWDKRKDEISGSDSVKLYMNYARSRDREVRDLILLHNRDDICQLSRLLRVFEKVDMAQGFFHRGFPAGSLSVGKITIDAGKLSFRGWQTSACDYRAFELFGRPCDIKFDRKSLTFEINLPLIYKKPFSIIDLRNFPMDFSDFSNYETFDLGFLMLRRSEQIHYRETIHFVKIFVDYILKELIL